MTQDELQDLSRKAAKLLPITSPAFTFEYSNGKTGRVYTAGRHIWLHESTEACAEIMVKVLLPKNIWLEYTEVLGREPAMLVMPVEAIEPVYYKRSDPMQAFRTAVLLALCEVMG